MHILFEMSVANCVVPPFLLADFSFLLSSLHFSLLLVRIPILMTDTYYLYMSVYVAHTAGEPIKTKDPLFILIWVGLMVYIRNLRQNPKPLCLI